MERVDVAIVGDGAGGLGLAARLRQEGETSFAIYDRADRVGGTWRDNTYPGAASDVPSHLFSFSFAPNPHWSRRFPPQAEMLRYLERLTDDFGLRPALRLFTEVTGAPCRRLPPAPGPPPPPGGHGRSLGPRPRPRARGARGRGRAGRSVGPRR